MRIIVLIGREYIQDEGSFTLTSGILSHDPIRTGTSAAMVNGAIESFVISSAIEMPRRIRINAVCPTILQELRWHSDKPIGQLLRLTVVSL